MTWVKHEETSYGSRLRSLKSTEWKACSFQSCQGHERQERWKNCSRLKEKNQMHHLHVMCDPRLDSGPKMKKSHSVESWWNLKGFYGLVVLCLCGREFQFGGNIHTGVFKDDEASCLHLLLNGSEKRILIMSIYPSREKWDQCKMVTIRETVSSKKKKRGLSS